MACDILVILQELIEDSLVPLSVPLFGDPKTCEHLWLYLGMHVTTKMFIYECGDECGIKISLRERDLLGYDPTDVKSIKKVLDTAVQNKVG